MTHQGPDTSVGRRPSGVRRVARGSRRLGVALTVAGLSGVALTGAAALISGHAGGVGWFGSALGTSLAGDTTVAWAFHVAALTTFLGTWLFGLSLVFEGYLGIE